MLRQEGDFKGGGKKEAGAGTGAWLAPVSTSPTDVRHLAVTLPVNLGGETHLWQITGKRVCRPSTRFWA